MDRAERTGLGIAFVGHAALFAILSLSLFSARIPKPPVADSMDVQFVDKAALTSSAPKVAQEAPATSEAPEQGKPEESAPPPPAPEPVKEPEPEPAPPKPAPKPKPAPPKPTPPKPEPRPEKPKPEPKPEKPKPEPKPEKPPEPKPKPEKTEKAKPDKTKPDKTDKAKPDKSAKASSETSAAKTAPEKPARKPGGLPSDFLKDLKGSAKGEGKTDKPKGSRLGADFLKGLKADKSPGKADAPRAAAVSAQSMAGLVGMIAAQVKPCYNPPAGGADAAQITTILSIRMNKDGSVAGVTPGQQSGVNGSNRAYAQQMADAAVRAVRRCAPLKLPPELYQGGWDDFDFRFRPEQMQ